MIIPLHFQRELHKEEQACSKSEGCALPWTNDCCLFFAAPRKDCWMKERRTDSSHLGICGVSSMEARPNRGWVNSSVTPLSCSICCYYHSYRLFLYIPASNRCPFISSLYKSEEHILHFMKAEKGCFSGSARGGFQEGMEKRKNYTCMQSSHLHTHCIVPGTIWSLHKPQKLKASRFCSTKEAAFGSS